MAWRRHGVGPRCENHRGRIALCSLVLVALSAVCANGGEAPPTATRIDREAETIFHEYMSPYCPGLLLANCPSPAAESLRAQIHAALSAGTPARAVRSALERRFGDRILAAPPVRGFGLVAWLVPALFIAAGGVALATWLRSHARGMPAPPAPAESYRPEIYARLEDELRSV